VRLFYQADESDDTVVQPDISVICDSSKLGNEGCRGAPDLVVEILSPSNTVQELARKFTLYQRAGVREYWEVYPDNKSLRAYRFQGEQIISHTYVEENTVSTETLPGLEIALAPVFAG
jgi:Uma2 family endonuclease